MEMRKARAGVLLFGTERFKNLGEGTENGTYNERKLIESQEIADRIKKICEVVLPGIIYTRDDIIKAMQDFYSKSVDFVLVIYLSWAEDFHWIRFLRDMPEVPILFAHPVRDKISLTDTHDENEFVEFLSAGGVVGSLEASGSIGRMNRKMIKPIIGTWDEIISEVDAFGNAARARNILKESKIGLLSSYNEVMWSTYIDPYSVFARVGPEIHFMSVDELVKQINNIDEDEVIDVFTSIESKYRVKEDVDMRKFKASIKASIALEKLSQKNDIDLLVLNDLDKTLFERVGLRPGFYPCPGKYPVVIVPEGDIGGGLAVYINKLLSNKSVNFIEPFHIYNDRDCFAAGHAGPNDFSDINSKVSIARDVRFAKTDYKYAGAPFAWTVFSEGEKTMTHISQCTKGSGFKMVITQVEVLPTKPYLASYSHADIKPGNISTKELFNRMLSIGVTQHFSLVQGNYLKELSYLAEFLNFELHII